MKNENKIKSLERWQKTVFEYSRAPSLGFQWVLLSVGTAAGSPVCVALAPGVPGINRRRVPVAPYGRRGRGPLHPDTSVYRRAQPRWPTSRGVPLVSQPRRLFHASRLLDRPPGGAPHRAEREGLTADGGGAERPSSYCSPRHPVPPPARLSRTGPSPRSGCAPRLGLLPH